MQNCLRLCLTQNANQNDITPKLHIVKMNEVQNLSNIENLCFCSNTNFDFLLLKINFIYKSLNIITIRIFKRFIERVHKKKQQQQQ